VSDKTRIRFVSNCGAPKNSGDPAFNEYMRAHHEGAWLDSYSFKGPLLRAALDAWKKGGAEAVEKAIKEFLKR